MKTALRIGWVASFGCLGVLLAGERPASAPETGGENQYGRRGAFELGGSVGLSWNRDVWEIALTPTAGYFIADRIELSIRVGIDYENFKEPDGTRDHISTGKVLFEPSYHLPLCDTVFAFGGVGAGLAYNGSNPAFNLEPRVGLNIDVGRNGLFSPALSVPILFGSGQGGPAEDDATVLAGLEFEAGFATTF